MSEGESEQKVKEVLALIEAEKKQPKPDKKKLRKWFWEIYHLKEDWRITKTGQDDWRRCHTSMRTFRDDC